MLQNQKILLIEGAPKKNWKLSNNYSNRVSALNPSTKKLLESVDVWNHIKAARFKPVKQMKVIHYLNIYKILSALNISINLYIFFYVVWSIYSIGILRSKNLRNLFLLAVVF